MIVPKPPPQQAAPLHVPAPTPREPDEDEDLVSSDRPSEFESELHLVFVPWAKALMGG